MEPWYILDNCHLLRNGWIFSDLPEWEKNELRNSLNLLKLCGATLRIFRETKPEEEEKGGGLI